MDPNRKFTYVEMKFFTMWWDEQTDYMKDQVRQLVKEHRLEFVNAGWSMTDEAAAHYDDMLNNMIIGHEFLKKEFDYVPTIGWHVDPFGHSNANPRLFADMGFEAWWFARADYEDFEQRTTDKSLQFVWRPFYESLGNTVEIFTNMFYGTYYWPAYFNVDER